MKQFNKNDGDGLGPYRTVDIREISPKRLAKLKKEGKLVPTKGKRLKTKYYLSEAKGLLIPSFWDDITRTGTIIYPTEKPIPLLERLIKTFTKPGYLVADFFAGSGVTLSAAHGLKRNWIGCDRSKVSVDIIKERMQRDYGIVIGELEDLRMSRLRVGKK